MSRHPRGAGAGAALTRTEQLRQARAAALVKNITQKEEVAARQQVEAAKIRRRISRPEAKKVDFARPTMTKAMLARMKQAEKFKQEYERKREIVTARLPRTPAPIGGDARMGRESLPSRARHPPPASAQRAMAAGTSKRALPSRRTRSPEPAISKKATELAKVMNADIIQAEQVGTGPVTNIIIPPGVVNEENTTIVNITSAPAPVDIEAPHVASRSIQVISESLDEQDAAENAAVQSKLTDLQQARRDFVIAVANVGGNAVHIDDEAAPSLLESAPPSPRSIAPHIPVSRRIFKLPDVEDRYLQPEYGLDHPDILAARAYMEKAKANMEEREAARRMEQEFGRAAAEQLSQNLELDVPFEEEMFLDQDISWEEDEAGVAMPCPSKMRAAFPPIPKQQHPYHYDPFDPEELERFFDLHHCPTCGHNGAPPGREQLHPDLWELEDPWYIPPPPPPDMPDLIQFD